MYLKTLYELEGELSEESIREWYVASSDIALASTPVCVGKVGGVGGGSVGNGGGAPISAGDVSGMQKSCEMFIKWWDAQAEAGSDEEESEEESEEEDD